MVTADTWPEDDEPDEVDAPDEPDDVVVVVGEVVAVPVLATEAVVVVLLASAGSWPETSWTRMPPVVAMNVAVATPTIRRRIWLTRRRRACNAGEGSDPDIETSLESAGEVMDQDSPTFLATP